MDSLVEYVAIYANILVRSKELDELRERVGELRERVEKAKKLYTAMPAPLRQKQHKIHSPRRTEFTIPSNQVRRAGDQSMGGTTMTDTESGNERRHQLERYRAVERETTEPLAALLLHDIVLELEADLKGSVGNRRVGNGELQIEVARRSADTRQA